MNPKIRDKVMFLCLLSFAVSVAIASLEQKVAIILLIVSSGAFILIGFLRGSRHSRSANPSQRKAASNNEVNHIKSRFMSGLCHSLQLEKTAVAVTSRSFLGGNN